MDREPLLWIGAKDLSRRDDRFRVRSVEARLQAAEDRERTFAAERDEEHRRVGHALGRARTQLLELEALRSQRADRDPALLGAA